MFDAVIFDLDGTLVDTEAVALDLGDGREGAQLFRPRGDVGQDCPNLLNGGGGVCVRFQHVSHDTCLGVVESDEEDEWRFGTRDSDVANDNDDTPIEIDLDEAA